MSKFVVSARKYRPTTFDEVVGQMHVAKTLKNALQTEQLAHAFLFCGPRGVGKTTCARILAKVINCMNPQSKVEPCNACSSCISFNDNASFNIIELDAASNNSVEHIRTLIEQVRFQPQQGTHKVFIIDEVHMLSSQAFNAFLKTLEEPPPYAIFILATTEKHKIIPTILSRCQIFDFKRIQVQDAVAQLQHICEQEGKTADPEALHLIGQKADGAMRDALSIFDKIASASGAHITYKDVIANLNILDYEYYFKVVDAFLRQDLSDVLLTMDAVIRAGFEPDQFIQGLADHMRDLLVCKDGRTLSLLDVSESLKSRYQHQAALTNRAVLLSGLDILNQCDIALPRSKNKRLYTEIALSKIAFTHRALEVDLMSSSAQSQEKKTDVVSNVANQVDTVQPSDKDPVSTVVTQSAASQDNSVTAHVQLENDSSRQIIERAPSTTPKPDVAKAEEHTAQTIESQTPALQQRAKMEENEIVQIENPASHQSSEHIANAQVALDSDSESPAIDPTSETVPPQVSKPKSDAHLSIVKPSGLDAILASVKAEEKQIAELRKGLNQETLDELWTNYAAEHQSPSTKAMLEMAIVKLDGKRIDITVPSNHYKNMVLEEDDLKDLLRRSLGTPDLMLNPVADRSAFPDIEVEKPKILLSTKEKYQHLADKHPALRTMAEHLELKPDTGGGY